MIDKQSEGWLKTDGIHKDCWYALRHSVNGQRWKVMKLPGWLALLWRNAGLDVVGPLATRDMARALAGQKLSKRSGYRRIMEEGFVSPQAD